MTTKMWTDDYDDGAAAVDASLDRLGLDYIDYYWLHALAGTNYENVQKVGAFDFLVQKKEEGRIRHIGFSFHDSPELLERILKDHPETEYVQLQLNDMWVHSPPLGAQANFNRMEKRDTM